MFSAYATGEWTMRQLTTNSTVEGCAPRPGRSCTGTLAALPAHRQDARRSLLHRHRQVRGSLIPLQNQQLKLIEMRYADAISLEQLKSEQERITRELAQAQQIIDQCCARLRSTPS
jgi:hypothetical protein